MRVIILGSGGFIASSVEKKLKKKKINVVSFSRNKLDLTKSNSHKKLKKIIKKNDYVFFASAKAPVKNINMLIYNLQMLKSVSDGIDPLKIKKFIYLSSDAVYADTKKKITENSIISSDNLHGQMHRTREIYFEELKNRYTYDKRTSRSCALCFSQLSSQEQHLIHDQWFEHHRLARN